MARRLAFVLALSTAALGLARAAEAQPGLGTSPYHATPPLPQVMPTPMPSLPPPVSRAPGETPQKPFPNSDIPFSIVEPGFVAHVERDGRVRFEGPGKKGMLLVDPIRGPMIRRGFDLFGGGGEDPYLHQKLDALDRTRPTRARMKANWESEMMERALADLPAYLQAVWHHRAWSPEVRRQVLFDLWDEAAEDGPAWLRDGGVRARLIISRFIASRIPPDSDEAYTAAELSRLNRGRESRARFAPYADPADPMDDRLARQGAAAAAGGLVMMRYL